MRSSRSWGTSFKPIHPLTSRSPLTLRQLSTASHTTVCLRPDIVWWSDRQRELWLFELSISFESLMAGARERKRAKSQDLGMQLDTRRS